VKDVKMTYEGLLKAELFNNIGRAKAWKDYVNVVSPVMS
jgi:hypothetical protein